MRKICQNTECGESITRDTAIFCPYCGSYQEVRGWHYHQKPQNTLISIGLPKETQFTRPYCFLHPEPVKDILADENALLVVDRNNIFLYDLQASVHKGSLEKILKISADEEARIVILRPYIFILENKGIRAVHMESEEEFNFLLFAENQELRPFRNSKMIFPFERSVKKERQATLILAVEKTLLFLVFDDDNQVSKHIAVPIGFKSSILSFHMADSEEDRLFVYSVLGEKEVIFLSSILSENDGENILQEHEDLIDSAHRPSGGFQVKWAYTKKNKTYFLIRKNTGESQFLQTENGKTEILSDITFSANTPAFGMEQMLILFESNEFKNQLLGFHIDDQTIKEYNFATSECLNISIDQIALHPKNIVYFSGAYWGIFPYNEEMSPFRLAKINFDTGGDVLLDTQLKILNPNPGASRSFYELLPLIVTDNMICSYKNNSVIVLLH